MYSNFTSFAAVLREMNWNELSLTQQVKQKKDDMATVLIRLGQSPKWDKIARLRYNFQ